VRLEGGETSLAATLFPQTHRWTLTVVEGEVSIDAIEVR
jgi:hypothetical protein